MPHLSALSLALNRPGAVSLEQVVASLFAAGEQGAWYDPSDYSTMFETAAGASPISTVEKPVGLILDRRKGLVLGSELNDGLGDASNWTALGTNTIGESGDEITVTYVDNAGGATAALSAAAGLSSNLTVGKWYKVTGEAKVNTGSVAIAVSAATTFETAAITSTSFVAFTLYFLASNATTNTLTFTGMGSGEAITVRAISVKLLDGNHAYQTGSAARPVLRARYNLLTYSEQMSGSPWTFAGNFSIASNTTETTDPIGGNTAEKYTATGSPSYVGQTYSVSAANITYTYSCYAKKGNVDWALFGWSLSGDFNAYFDLNAGTVGTKTGSVDAYIFNAGNGWWRLVITKTVTSTGTLIATLPSPRSANNASAVNGEYCYVWGADLRVGTSAGDYQRIAAATDYATTSTITGQPFRPYLWFSAADGTGDSLITASVDFSASDEMTVCSGVAKQQNSATGSLVMLSASVSSNNGTFFINAPEDATYEYSGFSRGNAGISATQLARVDSSTWAGPDAHVLSYQSEISADTSVLRLNKTEVATANGDQGSGNYGNYPIYIGRSGGITWQLNAYVYGLIIRGKNCTAGELAALESYMAGKTGVTL